MSVGGIGYERKTEAFELPERPRIDDVLRAVRSILSQEAVQKITIELGKPVIYERYAHKNEAKDPELTYAKLSLYDVVRNLGKLEDWDGLVLNLPNPPNTPADTLIQIFGHFSFMYGLPVSHILVSEDTDLYSWLNLGPTYKRDGYLLGVPVVKDSNIPNEVLVVCAAKSRSATVAEVTNAVKLVMETKDERTGSEGH